MEHSPIIRILSFVLIMIVVAACVIYGIFFHTDDDHYHVDDHLLGIWESEEDPGWFLTFYDDGIMGVMRDCEELGEDLWMSDEHFGYYGNSYDYYYEDGVVEVYFPDGDLLLEMEFITDRDYGHEPMDGLYQLVDGEFYDDLMHEMRGCPEIFVYVIDEEIFLEFIAAEYSADGECLEITKYYMRDYMHDLDLGVNDYEINRDSLTIYFDDDMHEHYLRTYLD